jgi:hypothetical protein
MDKIKNDLTWQRRQCIVDAELRKRTPVRAIMDEKSQIEQLAKHRYGKLLTFGHFTQI